MVYLKMHVRNNEEIHQSIISDSSYTSHVNKRNMYLELFMRDTKTHYTNTKQSTSNENYVEIHDTIDTGTVI